MTSEVTELHGSILGRSVLRTEDPRMLTGQASFLENMSVRGMVEIAFVRSPHAHATIESIDVEAARAAPGVVDVVIGADLPFPAMPSPLPFVDTSMVRPLLAVERVRYVGEPVAVVLASDLARAVDAADLVEIDYRPLSAVIGVDAALGDDVLVHESAGTNLAAGATRVDDDAFDGCEVVVEARIVNQRMAAAPMENRVGVARWDDGKLTVWSCTQVPHSVRELMAALYQLEPDAVRVVNTDMGGGFGAKLGMGVEEIVLPWLARRVDAPVRWRETRSENMVSLPHARAQHQTIRIGGTPDGRITAYSLHVLMDVGAYPMTGPLLPTLTGTVAQGAYDIDRVSFGSASVVTNTTPVSGYRGAGRPEGVAAIERAVDLFAAETGLDPADVRRINVVPDDAFPYATKVGSVYDSGRYGEALERALEAAGYAQLRAEQAARRADPMSTQLGIGISCYVEITNPQQSSEYASIEVAEDGSVTVATGSSAHGQGHETTFAQIASTRTGIPMERIRVVARDTDRVPRGGGTGGSKSLQLGGSAVSTAGAALVDRARALAAERLECAIDDVVLDGQRGVFHPVGTPAITVTWSDLASAHELREEVDFAAEGSTFPFGAHVVVVDVDPETGSVTIRRVVAVDDAGVIINPMIVHGQVHGGLAAGIGQALGEEIRFDRDGNPITTTFADYGILSAAELPSFDVIAMETPTPLNPLGAKGIGESGTVGVTPAVQNAVIDAVSHLGVRHIDLPLTPNRVWDAVRRAGR